jgi:hypothetical protein
MMLATHQTVAKASKGRGPAHGRTGVNTATNVPSRVKVSRRMVRGNGRVVWTSYVRQGTQILSETMCIDKIQNPVSVTVRCLVVVEIATEHKGSSKRQEQLAHLLGDSSSDNLSLDKHNKKWTTTMRGIGGRSRSAAPSERYDDYACCESSSSNGILLADASVNCVLSQHCAFQLIYIVSTHRVVHFLQICAG